MKSLKETRKLVKQFEVKPRSEMRSKVFDDALKLQQSQCGQHASDTTIGSYIMHTKRIKFIAAAIVLIAAGISLFYWQSNKEIQIPPELAQMPVEEIIKIHNDLAESPYDSILVEAALKSQLNKIPAREILALAEKIRNAGSVGLQADSAQLAVLVFPPVTEMVEAANVIIFGKVEKVELDVTDLKKAILEKRRIHEEHYSSNIRADVEVDVHSMYPPDAVNADKKLILQPIINTRNLDLVQEGQSYLLLLKQDGDRVWMLPYQQGIYPVDAENEIVSNFINEPVSLSQAWNFLIDTYEVIHEELEPSEDVLEYRIAQFQSHSFTESWLALEYLLTLPEVPDIGDLIVNSVEKYHSVQVNYPGKNNQPYDYNHSEVKNHAAYITKAFDLLIYLNDRESIEKVISLSENNMNTDSVFNKSIFEYPTRDMQNKLQEAALQETVSPVISENPQMQLTDHKLEISEAIENYGQDPTESNLNRVFNTMRDYLRHEDKEFIPFLQEHVTSHWAGPSLITRLADPVFIPVLHECLQKEVTGDLLEALFICGEYLEAIDTGMNDLLAPIEAENWNQFNKELRRRAPIIKFLGTCGDITALPAIEYYLDEELLDSLYQTKDLLGGYHPFSINHLQQNAVLALALLEGESAIPKLKKIYQSDDIHIRILAAISLYYLGDYTGYELLDYFVTNTHRSLPEIEIRWHYDLAGGVFQSAMSYLESPQMDALMLERMRHGLEPGDRGYICSSSFVDKYEAQILRILVDQLSSKDRVTREAAYRMLKEVTGMDFPFNPSQFSGQQDKEIEAWRYYVEQYLAGKRL